MRTHRPHAAPTNHRAQPGNARHQRGAHGGGVGVRREIDEGAQRGGAREGGSEERLCTDEKGGKREEGRRTQQIAPGYYNLQPLQPRTPAGSVSGVPGAQSMSASVLRLGACKERSWARWHRRRCRELEDEKTVEAAASCGRGPGREARVERERAEWVGWGARGRFPVRGTASSAGGDAPRWSLTGYRGSACATRAREQLRGRPCCIRRYATSQKDAMSTEHRRFVRDAEYQYSGRAKNDRLAMPNAGSSEIHQNKLEDIQIHVGWCVGGG
ncbi:hypothetical protein FB451DRAFT_1189518 [Mycena latifolia]|nr:hypothetical protein FB451DRAFT_1189518 [Mycena latifolia]